MATTSQFVRSVLTKDEDEFVRIAVKEPDLTDRDIVYSILIARVTERYGSTSTAVQVLAKVRQLLDVVAAIRQGEA